MIALFGVSHDNLNKPDIDLGRFGTKRVWALRAEKFEPFRSDGLPVKFKDGDLLLSITEQNRVGGVQGKNTLRMDPYSAITHSLLEAEILAEAKMVAIVWSISS